MQTIKLHPGLDVHKDPITLAIAQAGLTREVRLLGTITNDLHALEGALTRIRKAHPGARLPFTGIHGANGGGTDWPARCASCSAWS